MDTICILSACDLPLLCCYHSLCSCIHLYLNFLTDLHKSRCQFYLVS
uniref:Uncharacterized protein n=1 Tax=Rhizophora mucronata TaxID=61149 RepID=A0A2P2N9P4_RHIMU